MKSETINLNMSETVKTIVSIYTRYEYDMTLKSVRYYGNAKAILVIFSLDIGEPIVLESACDDRDDLLAAHAPFMA